MLYAKISFDGEQVKDRHPGDDNAMVAKQRERLEKRAAAEEELMMRVPLAKKELKSMKAARRLQASGGALLDDFGDEVADLVQVSAYSLPAGVDDKRNAYMPQPYVHFKHPDA